MGLRKTASNVTPTAVVDALGEGRRSMRQSASRSAATQALLRQGWQLAKARGDRLPPLRDVGFQELSMSDEDGILLYLFAIIGATNRTFVDIGAAGVEASNTANLVVNDGWWGLHIDGRATALEFSQRFYKRNQGSRIFPPRAVNALIDRDNVNDLIADNGVSGEIDLLSLDIDSNDWWIWNALEVITPRVVVVEYQPAIGPDRAVTIPYDPAFDRAAWDINTPPAEVVYCGCSLAALVLLAEHRGYTFVGTDRIEVNGFFVRNDVLDGALDPVDVADCFSHPRSRHLMATYGERLATMPWHEVTAADCRPV